MAYSDFLQALAKDYGFKNSNEALTFAVRSPRLPPTAPRRDRLRQQNLSFAINTRRRGARVIDTVEKLLGSSMEGKALLDIGTAYAGVPIEAASRGATAYGIEINHRLHQFGVEHAKGERSVTLLRADGAAATLPTVLPRGFFDVIVLHDVFEHIYDTVQLVHNISILLKPGGIVHFQVPNGQCTRFVLNEGHKSIFGITLVNPDSWWRFLPEPSDFSIFYRRWPYFAAIFVHFGLSQLSTLNGFDAAKPDFAVKERITKDLHQIKQQFSTHQYDDLARAILAQAIEKYADEIALDFDRLSTPELYWKYLVDFWEAAFRKN
ncbi:methyltransferase domain-containing protein [Ensifer sp. IC3342]|nr:methyltransferase domain-containing protein [Ensifer sp. BRP08]MCA1450103.1 methyltransferase domain-containing protein [Ensifer sp. IC3342]